MSDERTLALWCPDWAFVAAGVDPAATPAITMRSGRVAACSHAARTDGVRRGMRRREAQSRSPGLVVLTEDPALAARGFEPVVTAVAELVPSVEVVRPGLCAVAVRRAARYFGGETRLAARLVAEVHDRTGVDPEPGIADGLFAAVLAAQHGAGAVPPGATPEFLAPMRVGVLDRPDLTGLLTRLGIHTLGALAALPAGEVLNRFGADGAWAHRLASGTQRRVRTGRAVPADLVAQTVLDPPVDRVDAAAFVARALAEQLHEQLGRHGLTCLRVAVEAETERGELLHRVWRHDGTLSAAGLADRVRWQLDGWLSGTITSPDGRPRAGLSVLRLVPDQLVAADGRQLDLLRDRGGVDAERDERVDRALTRVQGLLGHDAVVTAVLVGGRDPAEQVRLVPWTDPRDGDQRRTCGPDPAFEGRYRTVGPEGEAPWPGRLPEPAPSTVLAERLPADVRDATGAVVVVTGRGAVSAPPAHLSVAGGPWRTVIAWAGPWLADTRWWDPLGHRRRARFQLVCQTPQATSEPRAASGARATSEPRAASEATPPRSEAMLATRENESWYIDALYD